VTFNITSSYLLVIIIPCLNLSLFVIVGSVEDRPAPFSEKTLCNSLDARLRLLTPSIEDNDLSNTTAEECFLFNVHFGKSVENVSLDVVSRKGPVVQRLQKELDMLQEVGVWIKDFMLNIVAIHDGSDLRKQLQLVKGWLTSLTSLVIGLACPLHSDLKIRQQVVDLGLEIL
jgi:hypothetical protein